MKRFFSLLKWVLVAFLFCTPWQMGWVEHHPFLHFDHDGMLWIIEASQDLLSSETQRASWPLGQSTGHIDSYFLLLSSYLLYGDGSPFLFLYIFSIIGLTLSAWSAEEMCRTLLMETGMETRLAWVGGLLFGFQPLYTIAILEGHLYFLWGFWLPLLYTSLHQSKEFTLLNSLRVIGYWLGALLTSAYFGVCASILIAFVWIGNPSHRKKLFAPIFGIMVLGFLYGVHLYQAADIQQQALNSQTSLQHHTDTLLEIQAGSTTLSNLIYWTPQTDIFEHSLGPVLGWVFSITFILSLFNKHLWQIPVFRTAMSIGVFGFILSFGPMVSWSMEQSLFVSPFTIFYSSKVGALFHFPVRFLYLTTLCTSILFPYLLQRALNLRRIQVGSLILLAILDVWMMTGLPLRSGTTPILDQTIYETTPEDRALLELVPNIEENAPIEALRLKNAICAAQRFHHRPLVNECLGKKANNSIEVYIRDRLIAPENDRDWIELLPKLGIGAIVVHMDLWSIQEQKDITDRLRARIGPEIESREDETLRIWLLPVNEDLQIEKAIEELFSLP